VRAKEVRTKESDKNKREMGKHKYKEGKRREKWGEETVFLRGF